VECGDVTPLSFFFLSGILRAKEKTKERKESGVTSPHFKEPSKSPSTTASIPSWYQRASQDDKRFQEEFGELFRMFGRYQERGSPLRFRRAGASRAFKS
jgi:hypothetical protein